MNPSKRLAGPCSHCGRSIEYAAHLVGTTAPCPYCGQPTELLLATPEQQPSIPRRVVVFTIIAVVIMVLGLAACFIALKMAQNRSSRPGQPRPPAPAVQ